MMLENYLLAPGDIFWQKKSGKNVLLSKKGDLINFSLIKKLEMNRQKLLLENQINFEIQKLFSKHLREMRLELQVKEKIAFREKFIGRFSAHFIEDEAIQLELDLLAWMLFSDFSREEAMSFTDIDSEIFKRHLSVASTYTFCALLLGYYDSRFLTGLFTKTLRSLMSIGKKLESGINRERLENLNQKETFSFVDLEEIKKVEETENLLFSGFFERYDGTGLSHTNIREMIDLEIILIAINRHMNFNKRSDRNFFRQLINNEFKCDQKLTALIMKTLLERDKGIVQIIGLG